MTPDPLEAQGKSTQPLRVDWLAQEIRRVDGNHTLGAGALAAAILPAIEAAIREAVAGAYRDVADWLRHRDRPALMNPDVLEHLAKNIEWRTPADAQAAMDSLIAEKVKQAEEKGKECEWCDGLAIMCAACIQEGKGTSDSLIARAIEWCAKTARNVVFRCHSPNDREFESGCVQTRDSIVGAIRAITPASVREESTRK